MIGIYKIANKQNGKVYIGQSIDVERRIKQHKDPKTWFKNPSMLIYKAIRDYGIENFIFEIIEVCEARDLDEREVFWIKTFNSKRPNGYNIQDGGSSGSNWKKSIKTKSEMLF